MDIDKQIESISRDTAEIIEVEELKELLKQDSKVAYVGFEPSGKVHLGHALTIKKMKDLQNAGFEIKIFIANLHAYLNGKGSLEELNEIADFNIKCFKALGLDDDTTTYILGFRTYDHRTSWKEYSRQLQWLQLKQSSRSMGTGIQG